MATQQKCGKRNASSTLYAFTLAARGVHTAARVTIEEYHGILRGKFRVRLETIARAYTHHGFVTDNEHDRTVGSWTTAQCLAEHWSKEYAAAEVRS